MITALIERFVLGVEIPHWFWVYAGLNLAIMIAWELAKAIIAAVTKAARLMR